MTALLQAAAELQAFIRGEGWDFCFIGGIALQRWGEPRVTLDVDLTLLTGFGEEMKYVDALCQHYPTRIPDARQFAIINRVLLLKSPSGVPFDIALAGFPFEELVIRRSSDFEYLPKVILRTCSAEDLVILKAFADRPRDWADIAGILTRQRTLDSAYILKELSPLCEVKEAPEILLRMKGLLGRQA